MRFLRVLIVFCFIISFSTVTAQTLTVESFRMLENDLTAYTRGSMKYDQNGEVAALIKIVTTETDFNFDVGSLGIVATSQQKGEIWVYVPGGVQRITISHSQLGVLRNYYFPIPVEKAKTYELVLASGRVRTIIQDEVAAQYVIFKVTPQNAMVTIDNTGYGLQADGTVSQLLSYGNHSYRVDAPGFISESGVVEVGRERITREVNLKSSKGTVTLECAMKEAQIYLNGNFVGTGSWSGQLESALYQVEVKREGHISRTTSFQLQPQEERTIMLPLPQPVYGTISVTSQPIGATVYVDGEEIGTTPLLKGEILVGKRKVEFRKQDYRTVTMEVEIKEGQLNSFSTEMSDVFNATIKTEPSGATFMLEGQYKGQTPFKYETSSGDYMISLIKPGYYAGKMRVHLDASNPELLITLHRKKYSETNYYAGVNYQLLPATGIEVYAGTYLSGFNVEGGYLMSYDNTGKVWWIDNAWAWTGKEGHEYEYSLSNAISAYLGYGFLLSNSVRLTPRVGVLFNQINGKYCGSETGLDEQTYVVAGHAGLRVEYSPKPHLGIVCTPAYDLPINMGSLAKLLDTNTSFIKDWCSGFSFGVGIELYF